jgi:hypothetical protein
MGDSLVKGVRMIKAEVPDRKEKPAAISDFK